MINGMSIFGYPGEIRIMLEVAYFTEDTVPIDIAYEMSQKVHPDIYEL